MVSGKNSKATRNTRSSVVTKRPTPWGTIAAVAVVVLFAAGIFGYAYMQNRAKAEQTAALSKFVPSAENQDPSTQISGVVAQEYAGGQHVTADRQVAYTKSPPYGGAHDGYWAACNGVVYPNAVRTENLVHSLEHGAIWIAYNPDQVTGDALAVGEGTLYPALHRLEERGLVSARWGASETNRRAKYYELTAAGRSQLRVETANWKRYAAAVFAALEAPALPRG